MRRLILEVAFIALFVVGASAAENFIPGGHTYSPERSTLPELNSPQDQINLGTDLIEAEIYRKQREQKQFESQIRRFTDEQTLPGADYNIDY
ncbi:MAG: hypothetical protein AB7F76_01730 [Parvibaculaceae bacterium]